MQISNINYYLLIGGSMEYAIAVIDIGMTNKKLAIYDEKLQQLDAVYKHFEPITVKEPNTGAEVEAHDLEGMEEWFLEGLSVFAKKYPIKSLAVSTHGATFVCIDELGKACAPCIFYTHEPGKDFQDEFHNICGTREELQKATFSPAFGAMINPAKGIAYLQNSFPLDFMKTKTILYYPQYWGFLLTGVTGIEPTYAGCHTYLWDHKSSDWSPVVDKLKIRRLLPTNYKNTYETLGKISPHIVEKTGLNPDTIVTMGIHDSNASLLPYLANKEKGKFVLNSTGTWCVCMHPQETLEFNDEDIGKIVYFNLSALRKPVKTSIFVGGLELDTYVSLYKKINKTEEFPTFSFDTVNAVLTEMDTFVIPELLPNSGQFAGSKPGIWEKGTFYPLEDIQSGKSIPQVMYKEQRFFSVLDLSLAFQTEVALQRTGLQPGTNIFTEGGFRKNKLYNALLATVLHRNPVYLTSMEEATAFGAAMTGGMALTGKSLEEFASSVKIEYIPVEMAPIQKVDSYKRKWFELATAKL